MQSFEEWLTSQQMNPGQLTPAEIELVRPLYDKYCTTATARKEEGFRDIFYACGMQYYVAARFAARAGLVPTHGNLFHHAIDMCLKGALVGTLTVAEMKGISHHLPMLWDRFKEKETDPALARFDSTIYALDEFESIRYPNKIVDEGMHVNVVWQPEHVTTSSGSAERPPKYEVIIADIDTLVIEVLHRASVDPRFLVSSSMMRYDAAAREALAYQNQHEASWL
jgi:hypothetical protein